MLPVDVWYLILVILVFICSIPPPLPHRHAGVGHLIEAGVKAAEFQQVLVLAFFHNAPSSITAIRSALRMVDRRWAITMAVRPLKALSGLPARPARCKSPCWQWLHPAAVWPGWQQRPRKADKLALAHAQVLAPLLEHRIITLVRFHDKVMGAHGFSGGDFLFGRLGLP